MKDLLLYEIEEEVQASQENAGSEGEKKVNEKVFKLYKSAEQVGTEIKRDLLQEASFIVSKKDIYDFTMTKEAKKGGILDKAYGLFLLINLYDGFGANFTDKEKDKLKNGIIELIDYVNEYGYDASPYISKEDNQRIFKDKGITFTESLTWCFSCFIFAHRLCKDEQTREFFDLGKKEEELDKLIMEGFRLFVNNVIRKTPNGYELGWAGETAQYVGWGILSGQKRVSLYFTNSVCETFGDVEDSILGNLELEPKRERDQVYIDKIKNLAGEDIIKQFETICGSVGANVYKKYENLLGSEFFYEDGSVATRGQIEYSAQNPVLLNHLYALTIPIYTNYDKILTKAEGEEGLERYQIKLKDAVDLVYKEYAALRKKEMEQRVNRDYISFFGSIDNKKDAELLSDARINVTVLEALLVRARALIVNYVTKYPEKELGQMIGIIQANLVNPEKWGWADLQETERYVSALKEFYDYYMKYERPYAEKTASEKYFDENLDQIKKGHKKLVEDLNVEHNAEIKALQEKITDLEESVRNGSAVEKEIRNLVADMVKEQVEEKLQTTFMTLALSNGGGLFSKEKLSEASGKEERAELNDREKAFKQAFDGYLMSFLVDGIQSANAGGANINLAEYSPQIVLEWMKKGMNTFIEWFVQFAQKEESAKNSDGVVGAVESMLYFVQRSALGSSKK